MESLEQTVDAVVKAYAERRKHFAPTAGIAGAARREIPNAASLERAIARVADWSVDRAELLARVRTVYQGAESLDFDTVAEELQALVQDTFKGWLIADSWNPADAERAARDYLISVPLGRYRQ